MLTVLFVNYIDAFIIAAYVPEYRFGLDWAVVCARTTDLILFSLEISASGTLSGQDRFTADVMQESHDACHATHTRRLVSVGGGGRSQYFRSTMRSTLLRRRFIEQLLEFVNKHHLDGVDIDWEGKQDAEDGKALVKFFKGNALALSVVISPHLHIIL